MPHAVYNDSCHKLHGNYKSIASQDLFPQGVIPSNLAALQINKQETDSTKQKHTPVRKSTKQLFKYIIQTASCSDEAEIFSGSTHKNALTILLTR